jgi:hypothetical protein
MIIDDAVFKARPVNSELKFSVSGVTESIKTIVSLISFSEKVFCNLPINKKLY